MVRIIIGMGITVMMMILWRSNYLLGVFCTKMLIPLLILFINLFVVSGMEKFNFNEKVNKNNSFYGGGTSEVVCVKDLDSLIHKEGNASVCRLADGATFKDIYRSNLHTELFKKDVLIEFASSDLKKIEDYFYLVNCIQTNTDCLNFMCNEETFDKIFKNFLKIIGEVFEGDEIKQNDKSSDSNTNYGFLSKVICDIIKKTLVENYFGNYVSSSVGNIRSKYNKIYEQIEKTYKEDLGSCNKYFNDFGIDIVSKLRGAKLVDFYSYIIVESFNLLLMV